MKATLRAHRSAVESVRLATPADTEEIRALLRRPLAGTIQLAFERGPDLAIAAAADGVRHATALVRDPQTGELVGMGSRSVREVWLDGAPARIGYLGQLRVAPGARCLKRMRSAFALLAAQRRPDELPYDLTAIVADNRPARRLLERGLPGFPAYRPYANVRTFVMSTELPEHAALPSSRRARPEDWPAIAELLASGLRDQQLAPRYTLSELGATPDLTIDDFVLVEQNGALLGCAACWDQRRFKQVWVEGYAPLLGFARPLLNVGFGLRGLPRLPPPRSILRLGFVSHLVCAEADVFQALLAGVKARARERGLEQLAFALSMGHPLFAAAVAGVRARHYDSVLYTVHALQRMHAVPAYAAHPPHAEAALL